MHGRLVPERELDLLPEELAHMVEVLLVAQGDERVHGGGVQVVEVCVFRRARPLEVLLRGRPEGGIQIERHHLPVALRDLGRQRLAGPAARADVHQFERVPVHHHGANVQVPWDGQFRLGRAGHVGFRHLQALGHVLRVFRMDLPVHHARRVGPGVVQDRFHAVLPGLLQGRSVELEVIVAQVDRAPARWPAARRLRRVRGHAGRAPVRLDGKSAEVPLGHGIHVGADLFHRQIR